MEHLPVRRLSGTSVFLIQFQTLLTSLVACFSLLVEEIWRWSLLLKGGRPLLLEGGQSFKRVHHTDIFYNKNVLCQKVKQIYTSAAKCKFVLKV